MEFDHVKRMNVVYLLFIIIKKLGEEVCGEYVCEGKM